jgi:hypothetical protein
VLINGVPGERIRQPSPGGLAVPDDIHPHATQGSTSRVPLPRGNDCLCPTDGWAIATNSPRPRGKSNWCWNRSSSQASRKQKGIPLESDPLSRTLPVTRRVSAGSRGARTSTRPPHGPVARLPRPAAFSYPPVSPGQKGSALFPRVPRRYFPPLEGKRNRISGAIGFLRRRRR